MKSEYVDLRDGGIYVAGSRVSLASIIYSFREGASPETIQANFPTLSRAQVYGAIAYYLNHPEESESYLRDLDRKWAELDGASASPSEDLRRRLDEAKQRLLAGQR